MNSEVVIKVVQSGRDRRRFIELPWMIYRNDPNWIPPLLSDMRNTLNPSKNALLRLGPNRFYIVLRDGVAIGRLGVGMDNRLNEAKKHKLAYITLFESIEDYKVASALLDTGISWLREQGAETVTGPQSPSNGEDYRGLLIDGFSTPPVLLNSYNPPYYAGYFERYGFTKQFDRYAYYYDLTIDPLQRLSRGVALAKKRYGFKERVFDMKKLDREMKIIKEVVELSMPDWPDMIPPGQDEIEAEVAKLKQLAIPELVMFVENSAGDCLGFAVALPDYNQVLAHLNGRLFPVGFLKYLWYRRRITGVRMNLDARKAGGKLYKVYRVYQMPL